MNGQQVTELLDEAVRDVDVAPPPVESVATKGRRRLRLRRGAQVVGTACAVSAIAVAGLALRPGIGPQQTVPLTGSTSTQSHGAERVPTASDLVGKWHWVTPTPPPHRGTHQDPSLLTFTFRDVGLVLPPGHRPVLHWSGYVGCNNFATGEVHLSAAGAFATSRNVVTDLPCTVEPKPGDATVARVIGSADWVRLAGKRLRFYDADDHLVGVFVRQS